MPTSAVTGTQKDDKPDKESEKADEAKKDDDAEAKAAKDKAAKAKATKAKTAKDKAAYENAVAYLRGVDPELVEKCKTVDDLNKLYRTIHGRNLPCLGAPPLADPNGNGSIHVTAPDGSITNVDAAAEGWEDEVKAVDEKHWSVR